MFVKHGDASHRAPCRQTRQASPLVLPTAERVESPGLLGRRGPAHVRLAGGRGREGGEGVVGKLDGGCLELEDSGPVLGHGICGREWNQLVSSPVTAIETSTGQPRGAWARLCRDKYRRRAVPGSFFFYPQ